MAPRRTVKNNALAQRHTVVRIKAEIIRSLPSIWRVFEIPTSATLWDLHCALTDMFGWNDSHLHIFTVPLQAPYRGQSMLCDIPFGIPESDDSGDVLPDWYVTLAELIATESPAFVRMPIEAGIAELFSIPAEEAFEQRRVWNYTYDLGDSWKVKLTTEAIEERTRAIQVFCIAGERSGPPDDFGGIDTFNTYIAGRQHPEDVRTRKAWLQKLFPTWTPDGWRSESMRFSNPVDRLAMMLEGGDDADELIITPLPFTQRFERFVQQANDRVISPIVEHLGESFHIYVGTVLDNQVWLVGDKRTSNVDHPQPRLYRRPPGNTPLEVVQRTLYSTIGNMQAPHHIVPLAPAYTLHTNASEELTLAYLIIAPAAVFDRDTATQQWHPIGQVTEGTMSAAFRAVVQRNIATDIPQWQRAMNMMLLATFDDRCRAILGLEDNQVALSL